LEACAKSKLMVFKKKKDPTLAHAQTLGQKLGFSTMVSTLFQLHFEVENVISNCKMFFSTQNDVFNYLPK
jgi:hypothetical protein